MAIMPAKDEVSLLRRFGAPVAALLSLLQCTGTPSIPPDNTNNARSIAEFRYLRIGDVEQTVLIRGHSIDNPILLFMHGGPGSTEMVPFRMFHSELEKHFTVVLWEQRGTGKSYSMGIDRRTMNVDTFISDAHELTLYLLKEFRKEKILVVGHSWGTLLGLRFVQKYPQLVHAYVGSGQVVNQAVAERISFEYIKRRSAGNRRALEDLAGIDTPLPYLTIPGDDRWFDKLKTHRKWLVKTGGEFYQKDDYSTFLNMRTLMAPEYSLLDYLRFGLGSNFSLQSMWPEVMETNFLQPIVSVKVPVFFLQGRHDFVTPSSLVRELFEKMQAPEKQLIWFEASGHHPMYEEPGRFDDIIVGAILPKCQ